MQGSPSLGSDPGGQFLFNLILFSSSAVPHAQKAEILDVSMLLTKKKIYDFMVTTDDPVVFVIL